MEITKTTTPVNARYVLITLIAVLFTWILHEFAHWLCGELLGNNMTMTLNSTYPNAGVYQGKGQEHWVSAAGPIITLLQATIVFWLFQNRKTSYYAFPFLFTCLYMRVVAGALNFINPNDEGRISRDLGLGLFTISILVILFLGFLTYRVVRQQQFKWKFILYSYLLVMFFSSVLILADQKFSIKLLQ